VTWQPPLAAPSRRWKNSALPAPVAAHRQKLIESNPEYEFRLVTDDEAAAFMACVHGMVV